MISLPKNLGQLKVKARQAFYSDNYTVMADALNEAWKLALELEKDEISARIAHVASDLFNRAEMDDRALDFAYAAVKHKRAAGTRDIFLANYLGFLSKRLLEMGNPKEALPYANTCVEIYVELYGEEYHETQFQIQWWYKILLETEKS